MTPSTNLPDTSAHTQEAPETAPTPGSPQIPSALLAEALRKFISPKRQAANQLNAQQSTGPRTRTEEGKQKTRLNAHRHGITGQVRLLPDAERRAVEAFCAPIIEALAPVGGNEIQLARNIAEAQWRLNRARATEENVYAQHIADRKDHALAGDNEQIADAVHMASAFTEQTLVFDRLTLYEQRIRRGMEKDRKQLDADQQKRLDAHTRALTDAKLLRRYAAQNNEIYDPEGEAKENGGIVFSIDRLDTSITRDHRLKMASRAEHSGNLWIPSTKAA